MHGCGCCVPCSVVVNCCALPLSQDVMKNREAVEHRPRMWMVVSDSDDEDAKPSTPTTAAGGPVSPGKHHGTYRGRSHWSQRSTPVLPVRSAKILCDWFAFAFAARSRRVITAALNPAATRSRNTSAVHGHPARVRRPRPVLHQAHHLAVAPVAVDRPQATILLVTGVNISVRATRGNATEVTANIARNMAAKRNTRIQRRGMRAGVKVSSGCFQMHVCLCVLRPEILVQERFIAR
jgi:hypothetical protein